MSDLKAVIAKLAGYRQYGNGRPEVRGKELADICAEIMEDLSAVAAVPSTAGNLLTADQQRALVEHVKAIRKATKRLHDSWSGSMTVGGKEFVVIEKEALMAARWAQTENALELLFLADAVPVKS